MSDRDRIITEYLDKVFGEVSTPATRVPAQKAAPKSPASPNEDDDLYCDTEHQETVLRRLKNAGYTP
jgi:hypothetical protein